MAQLATRVWARLHLSYHRATKRNYDRMSLDFMAFLVSTGLSLDQVTIWQLLVFIEYLQENDHSPANISNYLAAIRAKFILYGLPTLDDERIQMYVKSLKVNRQLQPAQNIVTTDQLLKEIVEISLLLPHREVLLLYIHLLSFHFFASQTSSATTFDISRHLCKGDIFFLDMGATVLIKWSKTLQDRTENQNHCHSSFG